jgi:hypothetical protein
LSYADSYQAFQRVPPQESQGAKKGSLWRLTPAALRDGVISTTRYRKETKHKTPRRAVPALKRQLSGAKGGQATRNAQRRQQMLREARSVPNMHARNRAGHGLMHYHSPNVYNSHAGYTTNHQQQHFMPVPEQPASPYFFETGDTILPTPQSAPLTPPQMHVMYEAAAKPAMPGFNFGHVDFIANALVGHDDKYTPDTPSMGTEASFMSEEEMQSLHASQEPTTFLVEG